MYGVNLWLKPVSATRAKSDCAFKSPHPGHQRPGRKRETERTLEMSLQEKHIESCHFRKNQGKQGGFYLVAITLDIPQNVIPEQQNVQEDMQIKLFLFYFSQFVSIFWLLVFIIMINKT